MKNIGREKHKMPNLNTVCIFCGGVGFIQEKRISKKKHIMTSVWVNFSFMVILNKHLL